MTTSEMRQIAKMQAEFLAEALKSDEDLLDLMFPPKFMGIEEASEFLGIPLNTLYSKVGSIPHSKVGKRLIFTDRGLTRWVNQQRSSAVEVELQQPLRKVM